MVCIRKWPKLIISFRHPFALEAEHLDIYAEPSTVPTWKWENIAVALLT